VNSKRVDPLSRIFAYLAISIIALPIFALVIKVPWSTYFSSLTSGGSLTAVKLSIWTSFLSAAISLVLGVPLAWWLVKSNPKTTRIIRPLVLAPIALPPTVAGLALLGLLSRNGVLGTFIYQHPGWQMPFTTTAVVFTGLFIGIPFLVLIAESTFAQLPEEIEDAAVIDRVSRSQLLRLIALPQARNGITTGLLLAWARILGEFGATMMFAGSMPGVTQTWTIQIYQQLDVSPDTAYALSFLMVVIAMGIFVLIRNPLKDAFRR
jgi:molybdate transport system permease protein